VIGHRIKTCPDWAALINGFQTHVLDYDDSCDWVTGHPSGCILPAALAIAQQRGVDGKHFLRHMCSDLKLQRESVRLRRLLTMSQAARNFNHWCSWCCGCSFQNPGFRCTSSANSPWNCCFLGVRIETKFWHHDKASPFRQCCTKWCTCCRISSASFYCLPGDP